jgi:hypothetical protein
MAFMVAKNLSCYTLRVEVLINANYDNKKEND